MDSYILGIETSCDDTSAAVLCNNILLSNEIASQKVHEQFGGVVPELASRAHQQNIIPVVETAIQNANIDKKQITVVAFTRGPGLPGSLMVGVSFAKAFAWAIDAHLIEVDHIHAHVMSNFLRKPNENASLPSFPFLCLIVSGGHTQIVVVKNSIEREIIGNTIDDAAGETFDKAAKIMNLPYPGGPIIDKIAKNGNKNAFKFAKPQVKDLNFSFSGLKTSFLYFLRDSLKTDSNFIEKNLADLCASIQKTIIDILVDKTEKAILKTGIKNVALAGGVSANSGLRSAMTTMAEKHNVDLHIPALTYTTDNAAMIAMAGYFRLKSGLFANLNIAPYATGSKNK